MVRLSDAANAEVSDVSDAFFSITEPPPTLTLFADGFETGTVPGGPWLATDANKSAGLDFWGEKGAGARVHGGARSAFCAGKGMTTASYDNNMNSYMQHTGVNVAGHEELQVKFWIWFATYDAADYVSFQYQSGTTWVEFAGGRWSGKGVGSQTWSQKSFAIPAAAGANFKFRWVMMSNKSGLAEGVYVDDVEVTGVAIAGAAPQTVAVVNLTDAVPGKFELQQNYPNPFNPATTIGYELPEDGVVTLKVFNTIGQEVAVLAEGFQEAGYKTVQFNAVNLPSGVYFYRLTAGAQTHVKRFILMK
jgi:hypothetical protein